MVPLTINLIYEVHSGYFLCIRYTVYHIPLLKGSNRGVKQNSQGTIPRGPHHFPYDSRNAEEEGEEKLQEVKVKWTWSS